jgi:1,4-dihydroxy-2-naphthoate polyprenyltransferase
MQGNDARQDETAPAPRNKTKSSAHVVAAESVQSEEVPTIPIGSMHTVNALQPEIAVHDISSSTSSVRLPAPLIVHPAEYRRSPGEWLRIWWNGIRPGYLPLSLMPLLLGSVLAWTQTITPASVRGDFHPHRSSLKEKWRRYMAINKQVKKYTMC